MIAGRKKTSIRRHLVEIVSRSVGIVNDSSATMGGDERLISRCLRGWRYAYEMASSKSRVSDLVKLTLVHSTCSVHTLEWILKVASLFAVSLTAPDHFLEISAHATVAQSFS